MAVTPLDLVKCNMQIAGCTQEKKESFCFLLLVPKMNDLKGTLDLLSVWCSCPLSQFLDPESLNSSFILERVSSTPNCSAVTWSSPACNSSATLLFSCFMFRISPWNLAAWKLVNLNSSSSAFSFIAAVILS